MCTDDECNDFLYAVGPADDSELTLAPDSWPEPPAGEHEAVLAHYEAALAAEYETEREAGLGDGEILNGYDDTLGFQIQKLEHGFRIVYAEM